MSDGRPVSQGVCPSLVGRQRAKMSAAQSTHRVATVFCHVLNNIGVPLKGFIRSNSVLVCKRFRIHRYVAI